MTVENVVTPEGKALGEQMARLCDGQLEGKQDRRCATCAFRAGDHLANGSVATLMNALKCAMEGEPFWCHEKDVPCAGWTAMKLGSELRVEAPWSNIPGFDTQEEADANGG